VPAWSELYAQARRAEEIRLALSNVNNQFQEPSHAAAC